MIKLISFVFDLITEFVGVVIDGIGGLLQSFGSEEKKTVYDASFNQNPSEIISSWNHGFTVNGIKNISIKNSLMNQITYGGSGSGKTSNIIIPNLLHSIGKANFLVNDPDSSIRLSVSGMLHKKGVEQLIFDPSKPDISVKYNPLARVKSISDINKLAQLLIINTLGGKNSDPFWLISAVGILSIIFRLLVHYSPKKYCTIHNALYLLENLSYGDKVDKLIIQTNDVSLISSYKSFIANDPKLANSILSTAKAALNLFTTDTVIQVTLDDNLDFAAFREKRIILFINNSISNAKFYAPLTAVLLQQFFDFIMSELPAKDAKPVFFIVEEAFSLYFNSLSLTIANIRRYKGGISLIYQSYHQLSHQYGIDEAKSIEANCWTRVYLPGTPIDVATNLSKELGSFEFLDDKNIKHVRSLMTNSEIKEFDGILVFCGHHRAFKLPQKPYYKTRLKRRAKIPPCVPEVRDNNSQPELIPLD